MLQIIFIKIKQNNLQFFGMNGRRNNTLWKATTFGLKTRQNSDIKTSSEK